MVIARVASSGFWKRTKQNLPHSIKVTWMRNDLLAAGRVSHSPAFLLTSWPTNGSKSKMCFLCFLTCQEDSSQTAILHTLVIGGPRSGEYSGSSCITGSTSSRITWIRQPHAPNKPRRYCHQNNGHLVTMSLLSDCTTTRQMLLYLFFWMLHLFLDTTHTPQRPSQTFHSGDLSLLGKPLHPPSRQQGSRSILPAWYGTLAPA